MPLRQRPAGLAVGTLLPLSRQRCTTQMQMVSCHPLRFLELYGYKGFLRKSPLEENSFFHTVYLFVPSRTWLMWRPCNIIRSDDT